MKGLYVIILFLYFFASCKKDDNLIEVDVPVTTSTTTTTTTTTTTGVALGDTAISIEPEVNYDFRDTLVGVFTGTMTNSSTSINPSTGPYTSTNTNSLVLNCVKEGDFPSTKVKIGNEVFELTATGTYSSSTGGGSSMANCYVKITQHTLIFNKSSACGVMCNSGHSFNGTK